MDSPRDKSAAVQPLRKLTALKGCPISEEQAAEALKAITLCTSEDLQALGLGPPPRPVVRQDLLALPLQQRLLEVQNVINALRYNHAPGYFFNVAKKRPFVVIMEQAATILREALPIKCIEAVFLGLALTCGWQQLDRVPIGFKSRATANNQEYRHIVLVVYDSASRKYGALGLSRRPELMDKPLTYDRLSDLVADFRASYAHWRHELVKVRAGLPAQHNPRHPGPVCWRWCIVNLVKRGWPAAAATLDQHAASWGQLQQDFQAAASAQAKPSPHKTHPHSLGSQHGAGGGGAMPQSPRAVATRAAQSPLRRSGELVAAGLHRLPGLPSSGRSTPSSPRLAGPLKPASSPQPDACAAVCGSPVLASYGAGSASGSSGDDERFDSDSECNSIAELVASLRCGGGSCARRGG